MITSCCPKNEKKSNVRRYSDSDSPYLPPKYTSKNSTFLSPRKTHPNNETIIKSAQIPQDYDTLNQNAKTLPESPAKVFNSS